MGARIEVDIGSGPGEAEPWGEVRVTGGDLSGTVVGGAEIPNLIDELPLVAVAGALARGKTVIKDARELRVKESDRIASMVANLESAGVSVTETEDGMEVTGPARMTSPAAARSYGDHRVAMSMAVLALHSKEAICVNNIACVDTSYPAFWDDLRKLGGHVE